MLSNAARARCFAVTPRVSPRIAPRAYESQCGAPSPENAGTKKTPAESGTCDASNSESFDDRIIPKPSRSHCTTAPAMNTLPSNAYSVDARSFQATVASKLFRDTGCFFPAFINIKQPVPYVFLTMPGWKQHCPNSAACWSPATPAIGIPARSPVVSPTTSLDPFTDGNTAAGTFSAFSSASSQFKLPMLNSIVRDAFDASVTCAFPPVNFQISHESTVPNASSPASARSRAPFTLSNNHCTLVPEKYGSTTNPVCF